MRHVFLTVLMMLSFALGAFAAIPKGKAETKKEAVVKKTVKKAVSQKRSKKAHQTSVKKTRIKKSAKRAVANKSVNTKKSKKAVTSKASKKVAKKKARKSNGWNESCSSLLDNSVSATIALEKSLVKNKKKLTREQFDEQVHNELLVVQLNAWVCALSSDSRKGVSVEEKFLQDYSQQVQQRKL